MSTELVPPLPQAPANVKRGALLSLLTIPAGVAIWVLIWGLGFIASLVAALVAFMALWLYVKGAGRLTRAGAFVVVGVTVLTLLLAFFGGIVLDAAMAFGDISGLGAWGAFTHENFWPTFWELTPEALPEYLPDFGWAAAFGALGSYALLRSAFAATRPATAVPAAPSEAEDAVPPSTSEPDAR